MRNNLHRAALVIAAQLTLHHGAVNLAGRHGRAGLEGDIGEALVMAEVKVGGDAVIGDEGFAVLQRAQKAGIDVVIRIHFLHGNAIAARFEQPSERGGSNALAQG